MTSGTLGDNKWRIGKREKSGSSHRIAAVTQDTSSFTIPEMGSAAPQLQISRLRATVPVHGDLERRARPLLKGR